MEGQVQTLTCAGAVTIFIQVRLFVRSVAKFDATFVQQTKSVRDAAHIVELRKIGFYTMPFRMKIA
jgi:hypothetical protein